VSPKKHAAKIMKIWQKEKISVEKLQKKLYLRENKRLDSFE